jgi:hypothetical protein
MGQALSKWRRSLSRGRPFLPRDALCHQRTGRTTVAAKQQGIAKRVTIDNVPTMHAVRTPFRILTWCCVVLLALLSLLPAEDMMRTGMPGGVEHLVAYAGSASIAVAGYGYGWRWGVPRIIGLFWVYAGCLRVPAAFLARSEPHTCRFCSIRARSASWRPVHGTPRAQD